MNTEIKHFIKEKSKEIGFSEIGFTDAESHNFSDNLQKFIDKNYAGSMTWLEERSDWRSTPQKLWPDAKSIIMLAMPYSGPKENPDHSTGEISCYALGRDYHDVIKKKLKQLGREIIAQTGCKIKVFVDTAPVMEKPIAEAAGLGWQGKHGNLLSRTLGNWFFLGSIFTTLDIEADQPAEPNCGTCNACIVACPTNAFDNDGHLDPRKCISYLTIELKTSIPLEFRKAIGNRIYGCDICLNACPWNKFSSKTIDPKLAPVEHRIAPSLKKLLALSENEFRIFFQASPIKRIGHAKFISNCLIAAGNSNDPDLISLVRQYSNSNFPIIKEAAVWALNELMCED